MKRSELKELHYITHITNVPSIMRFGILSYNRADHVQHQSVAMKEIQKKRAKVKVPCGKNLHEYANLYVCARNPMMYKRRALHNEMCVLKVSPAVIDLPGVVIADRNASSEYVKFEAAPNGLQIVSRELVFAEYWTDANIVAAEKRSY